MPNESEPIPSRRDLLSLIGTVAGSAAMYQAMTSLGLRDQSRPTRARQARRRSQGRLGPDPRRRPRRHDGRLRAAQGRLQGAGAGVSTTGRAGATGRCAAATRYTELGGVDADMRVRRGPLHQSRARGAFRITTTPCSITASGSASRSSPSSRSTTTPTCIRPRRSAASRSAYRDIQADFHGHVVGAAGQGHAAGQARRRCVAKEDKEMLLEALRAWGALDANYAYTTD